MFEQRRIYVCSRHFRADPRGCGRDGRAPGYSGPSTLARTSGGLIRSPIARRHSTHGRITGLTLEQLKLLQAAFCGDVVPKGSAEDFQIFASKPLGLTDCLSQATVTRKRSRPSSSKSGYPLKFGSRRLTRSELSSMWSS